MLDREAWRRRIKMIVAANKEVDSSTKSKRTSQDSKIRRVKTGSATIVVI
jgi:hypothetical protein